MVPEQSHGQRRSSDLSPAQAPTIIASIPQALQFWKMSPDPGRASRLGTPRCPEAEPVRREGRGPTLGADSRAWGSTLQADPWAALSLTPLIPTPKVLPEGPTKLCQKVPKYLFVMRGPWDIHAGARRGPRLEGQETRAAGKVQRMLGAGWASSD